MQFAQTPACGRVAGCLQSWTQSGHFAEWPVNFLFQRNNNTTPTTNGEKVCEEKAGLPFSEPTIVDSARNGESVRRRTGM
jgi:hypothetical protein